jgi:cysteinyl-tRNA synthetase
MLRLFDTARGAVHPVEFREPDKVSIYACGPTVYGPPHIGHGRQTLVYDVLRRYLEWTGLVVDHVSNITDVDDNIINRATSEGRDWTEVATECEAMWWRAMDAVGALRPTVNPHASAFIERMVKLVQQLFDAGVAYETSDGVYFEAGKVPDYGLLALQSIDSLQAGARVEANEEKRSPIDFVLWKKAKPGEPSWPSPWGAGRPGWHTECVVMSLDLLGDGFDLHTGGMDLRFPHHENERAQAVALGHQFAHHWMHHAFVEVEGEKMSKSLGNFTNLLDLIDEADPRSYRLLVLQSHYRTPMEVTKDTVARAEKTMAGLDGFARRFASVAGVVEPDGDVLQRFRERMDDDLDTPGAMALLFDAETRANRDDDTGAAAAVFEMARAVGLELRPTSGEFGDDALAAAAERDVARAAKDWARADELRDQLIAMGYEVEDTPTGTRLRKR